MRKNISGSFRQPYSEPRMKVVDVKVMHMLCGSVLDGIQQNESYDEVTTDITKNWFN